MGRRNGSGALILRNEQEHAGNIKLSQQAYARQDSSGLGVAETDQDAGAPLNWIAWGHWNHRSKVGLPQAWVRLLEGLALVTVSI